MQHVAKISCRNGINGGKAKPADMAIQAQKEFKPTINLKEAAKIGLKVPEDLLKGADVIK